jgi:DNA polymerase/3'-5' exonuclease PolX
MNLREASHIASDALHLIKPYCRHKAVAGSVRRKKPAGIKNIEILAIPLPAHDLFGEEDWKNHLVRQFLDTRSDLRVSMNSDKEAEFRLRGAKVELYLVTPPAQWGMQLALRTGPDTYSRWLVTKRRHGGAMPSHLRNRRGALWNGAELIETLDEIDYFNALGIPHRRPHEREAPREFVEMIERQAEKAGLAA